MSKLRKKNECVSARLIACGLALIVALIFPAMLFAQEVEQEAEVVTLSDTVVGNQEQPTVLYIVPWKPADDTTILYLPLSPRTMENLFGHVERVEHRRQIQYINELDNE